MSENMRSRWVHVIVRYALAPLVAGALAALAASVVAMVWPDADIGFILFMAVASAVLIAWIAAAVSDKGPIVRRVLLPWAPCVPIVVVMIIVMMAPAHDNWERDGNGLALLAYFAMLRLAAVLATVGSVAAIVYRPGEGPLRPTRRADFG